MYDEANKRGAYLEKRNPYETIAERAQGSPVPPQVLSEPRRRPKGGK